MQAGRHALRGKAALYYGWSRKCKRLHVMRCSLISLTLTGCTATGIVFGCQFGSTCVNQANWAGEGVLKFFFYESFGRGSAAEVVAELTMVQ